MIRTLLLAASAVAIYSASAPAATVAFGGRFYPGFASGYVDAIGPGLPGSPTDDTGLALGDPVTFSTPDIFPLPEIVTVNTPNFGIVTMNFAALESWVVNPAGSFYTLVGTINGNGSGFISVNHPNFGIPSFGIFGTFAYNPPIQPPVIIPPPTIIPPPAIVASIPEPSTWLLLALGFIGLAGMGYSQRVPRSIN